VPLPAPTTTEIEELTVRIAERCTSRLTKAAEERGDYLDPNLASLVEALFWSRNPPPGTRDLPCLPGMEGAASEEDGLRGKPLCAAVAGFSLHAAQLVPASDRQALERLLRYGLRAPFSPKRLSRRPDGKVVYQLRRPWPNPQGMTHLLRDPLDFLRRLAALVSFPYSHQVRYHGLFSNHRKWAQLLLRVLHLEALACPGCSRPGRPVPMVVLAFLTDPEVVGKILRHLELPTTAPALAPSRSSGRILGFALAQDEAVCARDPGDDTEDFATLQPPIRPPP
jgi:hypothetical protein